MNRASKVRGNQWRDADIGGGGGTFKNTSKENLTPGKRELRNKEKIRGNYLYKINKQKYLLKTNKKDCI